MEKVSGVEVENSNFKICQRNSMISTVLYEHVIMGKGYCIVMIRFTIKSKGKIEGQTNYFHNFLLQAFI